MKNNSTFEYNFRAPGTTIDGPIRFATGHTTSGMVLIGQSKRGVCAIFLGEDDQALRDQLAEAFPGVELQPDQSALAEELSQVLLYFENDSLEGTIKLDIGGTAFEQKVWRALCDIPKGQTHSYSEVAQRLGVPESVRAIANACGANVLAIAIPCHRVVRGDGSLSGYRWGVDRKRALLVNEGVR